METTQYNFKKGLYKGFISMLTFAGAMIAFTKFGDMSIWELVEQYLKPLLGAMTAGGAITMLINFIKVKSSLLGKKKI